MSKFNLANKAKVADDLDDLDDLISAGAGAQAQAPVKKEEPKKEYTHFPSTKYTEAEQEKLLIGYDKVPEEAWTLLAPKTHIRYITVAGKFCRGGFVHNVRTKGKVQIFLETGFDPRAEGYAKWPVTLEDVAEIWKKRTLSDVRINEVQENSNVDDLRAQIAALEAQVAALAADQKKLVQLVGKINEKVLSMHRPVAMKQLQQPRAPGL